MRLQIKVVHFHQAPIAMEKKEEQKTQKQLPE